MSQSGSAEEAVSSHFGKATALMVTDAVDRGMERGILLMRHSARTFHKDIHDLENRLTDHGRTLCTELGTLLPKSLYLRGYASPPHRCMETAELTLSSHASAGGLVGRTRPVEALGVFYALDQQKMWKGMSLSNGLADYVSRWFEGDVPEDAMMPADTAVAMLLRVLLAKLQEPQQMPSLDVCVTHDISVFTLRHGVGLEPVDGPTVEFLDGLLLFERDQKFWIRSHHGGEVEVSA